MNIYKVILNNSGAELPEHDEEWFTEADNLLDATATVMNDPDQDLESIFDDTGLVVKVTLIAKGISMTEFEDANPDFFFT